MEGGEEEMWCRESGREVEREGRRNVVKRWRGREEETWCREGGCMLEGVGVEYRRKEVVREEREDILYRLGRSLLRD